MIFAILCQGQTYDFCFYDTIELECNSSSNPVRADNLDYFYNFKFENLSHLSLEFACDLTDTLSLDKVADLNPSLELSGIGSRYSIKVSCSKDLSAFENMSIKFLDCQFPTNDLVFNHLSIKSSNIKGTSTELHATSLTTDVLSSELISDIYCEDISIACDTAKLSSSRRISLHGSESAKLDLDRFPFGSAIAFAGPSIVFVPNTNTSTFFKFIFEYWEAPSISVTHNLPTPLEVLCYSYTPYSLPPHVDFNVGPMAIVVFDFSNWPYPAPSMATVNSVGICFVVLTQPTPIDIAISFIPVTIEVTTELAGLNALNVMGNTTISYMGTNTCHFLIDTIEIYEGSLKAPNPSMKVEVKHVKSYGKGSFLGEALWTTSFPEEKSGINVRHSKLETEQQSVSFSLKNQPTIDVSGHFYHEKVTIEPIIYSTPTFEDTDPLFGENFYFACAKHLECQKFSYRFPFNGVRGFVRGASLFEPVCITENERNCTGLKMTRYLNRTYNSFCFLNDKKCPDEALTIENGENWKSFISSDYETVTFYVDHNIIEAIDLSDSNIKIVNLNENYICEVTVSNAYSVECSRIKLSTLSVPRQLKVTNSEVYFHGVIFITTDISSLSVDSISAQELHLTGVDFDVSFDGKKVKVGNRTIIFDGKLLEIRMNGKHSITGSSSVETIKISSESDCELTVDTSIELDMSDFEGTVNIKNTHNIIFGENNSLVINSNNTPLSTIRSASHLELNDCNVEELDLFDGANTTGKNSVVKKINLNSGLASIRNISNTDLTISDGSRLSLYDSPSTDKLRINMNFSITSFPFVDLYGEKRPIDIRMRFTGTENQIGNLERYVKFFESNRINIACGSSLDCNQWSIDFESEYPEFNHQDSIMKGVCNGECIVLEGRQYVKPSETPEPEPPTPESDGNSLNSAEIVGIVAGSLTFIILVTMVSINCYKRKKFMEKLQSVYQSLA